MFKERMYGYCNVLHSEGTLHVICVEPPKEGKAYIRAKWPIKSKLSDFPKFRFL